MNPLGPPTVRPVARFSFALRIPVAWFLCGNERGQKRGGRVQVAGRIALCCWQAFATEVCPSLSARRSRTVVQVRRNYIAIERFVCGTCLELPARHAFQPTTSTAKLGEAHANADLEEAMRSQAVPEVLYHMPAGNLACFGAQLIELKPASRSSVVLDSLVALLQLA